jgi:chaperonin GroEL
LQELLPLLESVVQTGKPLLIVAGTSRAGACHSRRQQTARRPQGRGGETPGFGDRRKAMLRHRHPDGRPWLDQ